MSYLSIVASSKRRIVDPLTLGPALWLDGADSSKMYDATTGGANVTNGVGIARWEDKSGNGRHLTQSTPSARPTFQTGGFNGVNSVFFDGDDVLTRTGTTFTPRTFFAVTKSNVTTGVRSIFRYNFGATTYFFAFAVDESNNTTFNIYHNNGSLYVVSPPVDTSQKLICSGVFSDTQLFQYINGVNVNSDLSGSIADYSNVTIYVGGTIMEYFNGNIAEIIIYPYALTSYERKRVEKYLSLKYAIPVS